MGSFVREQIEAQKHQPNPIRFTTPDGSKCNVWLAGSNIGDDPWWRVNALQLPGRVSPKQRRQERQITLWNPTARALNRPIVVVDRNEAVKDLADALGVPKGFRLRLCIDTEKELQVLGCGWRIVTCQFRGHMILLHHHKNVATMKPKAFKEVVAANRRLRRKRPKLRLVVFNSEPRIAETKQAA